MSGGYDIERRMAEIVGRPPRVPPVDEANLPPEAEEAAKSIRAALGKPEDGLMPESFRMMLINPKLFNAQLAIGVAVASGLVPPRERELAVLRSAWICGAPYEWGEHVDIAKQVGLTPEEIARCTVGSAAEGWGEHDGAIVRAVEELHGDYAISDATWTVLAKTWSDRQLAEFPVLVGAYTMTAMLQNSLRYRLRPHNPGLDHR